MEIITKRPDVKQIDITPAIYLYGNSFCFSWLHLYLGIIWSVKNLKEWKIGNFSIVLEAIFEHFALLPVINYSPDEGPFTDISVFWTFFGITLRKYRS